MKVLYLTSEEILRIHFQVIEDFGGSHGVRDEGRLVSAVSAPKQVIFGEEQYVGIIQKAAVYLRNLIGDHLFQDGNKRTAITACGIFLARNGKTMNAKPKFLEDFTVSMAVKHLNVEEIAIWLEGHCK